MYDVVATSVQLIGDRVLHLWIGDRQGMGTSRITVNRKPLRTRSDSPNQDPVLHRGPGAGYRQCRRQNLNVVPARGEREREIPDVSLFTADVGRIELRKHQDPHFATSR
jgi:hypothetical protein